MMLVAARSRFRTPVAALVFLLASSRSLRGESRVADETRKQHRSVQRAVLRLSNHTSLSTSARVDRRSFDVCEFFGRRARRAPAGRGPSRRSRARSRVERKSYYLR